MCRSWCAVSSDEAPVLAFPRNFTPLPHSRWSCGTLSRSGFSDAPENCQSPAHTSPAGITSRKPECLVLSRVCTEGVGSISPTGRNSAIIAAR